MMNITIMGLDISANITTMHIAVMSDNITITRPIHLHVTVMGLDATGITGYMDFLTYIHGDVVTSTFDGDVDVFPLVLVKVFHSMAIDFHFAIDN